MRYIDAEKLYESMQWNIQHDMYDKPFDYLAEIDYQPTADVVEIVRCKDCKHYCPVYADTMGGRDCLLLKTITRADDFCSYGERKENVD